MSDEVEKPVEESATPAPVSAPVSADAAPADPAEPIRPTQDELAAHAERIANIIGVDLGHALTAGLACKWDAGLLADERDYMRPRIARALHARLDAMMRARGFDATGDTERA